MQKGLASKCSTVEILTPAAFDKDVQFKTLDTELGVSFIILSRSVISFRMKLIPTLTSAGSIFNLVKFPLCNSIPERSITLAIVDCS